MNTDLDMDLAAEVANIQGLGAFMRNLPSRREKSVAKSAATMALRSKTVSRTHAVAALKAGELNADAQKSIKSGNSRLERGVLYYAKQIASAAGTNEVLNNPVAKSEGVTNFDDGKSPNDVLVDTITLLAGNSASANVGAVEFYNVADLGVIPSWYLNSEIEIRCNGRMILPAIPMSEFFSTGSAGNADSKGKKVLTLNSPEWIMAGEKPSITIRSANGSAIYAANNSFLKVEMSGLVRFEK